MTSIHIRRGLRLSYLPLLLAAACSTSNRAGSAKGNDAGVAAPATAAEAFRDIQELSLMVDDGLCDCTTTCPDPMLFQASESEKACADDVVTEFSEDFEPLAQCLSTALSDAIACIEAGACVVEALQACLDDLSAAEADCPGLPEPALDDLDACEEPRECSLSATGDLTCRAPEEVFTCDNGKRIPAGWECDLEPDCRGGEDESDCPEPFDCGDGTFVPAQWRCDGLPDCLDASDETGC